MDTSLSKETGYSPAKAMNSAVPKEILEMTTKCPHGFSCLDSGKCGNHPLCEISSASGKNLLCLVSKNSPGCPYQFPFGYGHFCTCPTHYAMKSKSLLLW